MLKRLIVLAGLTAAVPAFANMTGSFFTPRLEVNQISATEFEVLEGLSEGARTYWCAAAFHANFTLGRDDGRLYLSRGFGPARTAQGTRGVSFSLVETPEVRQSIALTLREEGTTLLIGHALQFCRDSDLEADQ